jgi:hypothetical protein
MYAALADWGTDLFIMQVNKKKEESISMAGMWCRELGYVEDALPRPSRSITEIFGDPL